MWIILFDAYQYLKKQYIFSFFLPRVINKLSTIKVARAGFRGQLLICLLNLTLNEKSSSHTLQFRFEVLCLLKFTLGANSESHTLQFGCGSLILYCSRIRKHATYRIRKKCNGEQTDTEPRTQLQRPLYHRTDGTPGGAGQYYRWGRYLSDCQYRQTNKPTIHARIVVHCACLLPNVLVMVNCSFSLIQRINKVLGCGGLNHPCVEADLRELHFSLVRMYWSSSLLQDGRHWEKPC